MANVVVPCFFVAYGSSGGLSKSNAAPDLLDIARAIMKPDGGNGFTGPVRREVFADEFVLRGPVVGPIVGIDAYESMMRRIGPYNAFDDIDVSVPACWADPGEPALISCVTYMSGTQARDWSSPLGTIKAASKLKHSFKGAGEVVTMLFDGGGKLKLLSPGYTINRNRGTGCGFGGVFGIQCAMEGSTAASAERLAAIAARPVGASDGPPGWWSEFCEGPHCP